MNIEYKKTNVFTAAELQGLFLSVKWESGNYPEKLVRAMQILSCNFGMGWKENKKLCGLKIVSCFYAFLA
jgi:hypothetical protein